MTTINTKAQYFTQTTYNTPIFEINTSGNISALDDLVASIQDMRNTISTAAYDAYRMAEKEGTTRISKIIDYNDFDTGLKTDFKESAQFLEHQKTFNTALAEQKKLAVDLEKEAKGILAQFNSNEITFAKAQEQLEATYTKASNALSTVKTIYKNFMASLDGVFDDFMKIHRPKIAAKGIQKPPEVDIIQKSAPVAAESTALSGDVRVANEGGGMPNRAPNSALPSTRTPATTEKTAPAQTVENLAQEVNAAAKSKGILIAFRSYLAVDFGTIFTYFDLTSPPEVGDTGTFQILPQSPKLEGTVQNVKTTLDAQGNVTEVEIIIKGTDGKMYRGTKTAGEKGDMYFSSGG